MLARAATIWTACAFLTLLAWRESAPAPAPAVWPAWLRIEAPAGGDLCASRELARALRERAFEWVVGPKEAASDDANEFTLVCTERDAPSGAALGGYELRSPRREEPVFSDAFSAPGPPSRDERERLASALAARLAAQAPVAAEAERVFLAGQNAVAQAGALAFERGDWPSASRLLFHGLEGVVDPSQAYYGLSAANARLGRADRALWYALAFVKTAGGEVAPASLAHLKGLPAPAVFDAEAASLYDEARRLIAKRQLRQALVILKLACERVPWDPRPAEAVAQLYDGLGFSSVAAGWRARARLARAISSDAALKASFLTAIP